MATVIFYNFILLSSTFFVWLSEKGKGNLERYFFLGIAFLLVFVPAAVRYDIGNDFLNYLSIYEDNFRVPLESYKFTEPGFYFVNWLLRSFEAHFQWVFVVYAFVFTAAAFKAYPKKDAWILHFIFFSSVWFFSFNVIRQTIASAFILLALVYFLERKNIKFILVMLLAVSFHQSSLAVLFLGAMSLVPLSLRLKSKTAPAAMLLIVVVLFFNTGLILDVIGQLLNWFGLAKYAAYYNSSRHFVETSFGSGIGIIVFSVVGLYIAFNSKRYFLVNERYWLLIGLTILFVVGSILGGKIVIFGRMADLFKTGFVLAAFKLWAIQSRFKVFAIDFNRVFLALFMVFLMMAFVKTSFGTPTSYSDPKRNPYQTIFNVIE